MDTFLGRNIRFLRKAKGLNQGSLATTVGVGGQSTIANWENDSSNPDLDTFIKIIKYFDVSADDILFKDLSKVESAKESPGESPKAINYKMEFNEDALKTAIKTMETMQQEITEIKASIRLKGKGKK